MDKDSTPVDVISLLFYGTFAGFFYVFTNNKDNYNDCGDDSFLDWSNILCWVCIILAGELFGKLISGGSTGKSKLQALWSGIEAIGGLFVLICTIALSIVDNNKCGKLHVLVMIFYIFVYVSLGIAALFVCCACIFCGSAAVAAASASNGENQPLIVQQADGSTVISFGHQAQNANAGQHLASGQVTVTIPSAEQVSASSNAVTLPPQNPQH